MDPVTLLSRPNQERLQSISIQPSPVAAVQHALQSLKGAIDSSEASEASLEAFAALVKTSVDNNDDDAGILQELAGVLATDLRAHSRTDDAKAQESQSLAKEAGLGSLLILCKSRGLRLDDITLRSVTAYTDPRASWTTPEASGIAQAILSTSLDEGRLDDFITSQILQDYLRPMFSQSSTRAAPAGRTVQSTRAAVDIHQGLDQPLWKAQGEHVVSTFWWSVQNSTPKLIKNHWPLFIPVLLTMAEDQDAVTRKKGIDILTTFIDKCPGSIIRNVGLDKVFQDAIFPSLLYLPSLTPEAESVPLLQSAYEALVKLAVECWGPSSARRQQLLDKVLRDGIITGYDHASQYSDVVEVLMHNLGEILNALGILSIKHLAPALTLISSVMRDPFMITQTHTVLAGSEALKAVIVNCWPRIVGKAHEGKIVNILSISWLNLSDMNINNKHSATDTERVTDSLITISQMLQTLRKACGAKPPPEVMDIVQQQSQLQELFHPISATLPS